MLERLHDYLERSFLPGRTFTGPEDFNTQLSGFFTTANGRKMRVLGCTPGDRVAADRAAMLSLPGGGRHASGRSAPWRGRVTSDHLRRFVPVSGTI
jgi:hypothetical protein